MAQYHLFFFYGWGRDKQIPGQQTSYQREVENHFKRDNTTIYTIWAAMGVDANIRMINKVYLDYKLEDKRNDKFVIYGESAGGISALIFGQKLTSAGFGHRIVYIALADAAFWKGESTQTPYSLSSYPECRGYWLSENYYQTQENKNWRKEVHTTVLGFDNIPLFIENRSYLDLDMTWTMLADTNDTLSTAVFKLQEYHKRAIDEADRRIEPKILNVITNGL